MKKSEVVGQKLAKVGETLVKRWSQVGQVGEALLTNVKVGQVGDKLVKLVKIGDKLVTLVKNWSIWSSL